MVKIHAGPSCANPARWKFAYKGKLPAMPRPTLYFTSSRNARKRHFKGQTFSSFRDVLSGATPRTMRIHRPCRSFSVFFPLYPVACAPGEKRILYQKRWMRRLEVDTMKRKSRERVREHWNERFSLECDSGYITMRRRVASRRRWWRRFEAFADLLTLSTSPSFTGKIPHCGR